MGVRRRARELSLQFLYQVDLKDISLTSSNFKEELEHFWENSSKPHDNKVIEFSNRINIGTIENSDSINSFISRYSENWKISRISAIDKQILRMAIFELLYTRDIPNRVVINEAIEIAKKYGTEESSSFINGILDKIRKDIVVGAHNDDE